MSPAPALAELQRWMKRALTDPRGAANAFARERRKRFRSLIPVQGALGPGDRLAIYGDGYFARLTDCLGHNLPALKNVLGDSAFESLAKSYLAKHPSTFRSVDEVGHRLPEFLAARRDVGPWKFISDLARLEWACHRAFYADDGPAVDPTAGSNRPPSDWEKARLVFSPSVRWIRLKWPVFTLWREEGRWTRGRLRGLRPRTVEGVVFRNREFQVRAWEAPPGAEPALRVLARGASLGKAFGDRQKMGVTLLKSVRGFWLGLMSEGAVQQVIFSNSSPTAEVKGRSKLGSLVAGG
jgi:hypothetical protein